MRRGQFQLFPQSLRRRYFLTAVLALLVTALVAFVIVLQTTGLRAGRHATLVRVNDESVNQLTISGTGSNLVGLPGTNLVANGSFSPQVVNGHYFAYDGGSNYFDIKISEARSLSVLSEGYYQGADFRLFRESLQEMALINTGQVTSYELGKIQSKREVDLSDFSEDVRWNAFAGTPEGTVFLCGTQGSVARVLPEGITEPIPFPFNAHLTAIAVGPTGLVAGDLNGRLYASPDGEHWNLVGQSQSGSSVRAVEYIDLPDYENGFFLASGGGGELFFGHPSGFEPLSFPFEDQITAIIQSGDDLIYALGDRGNAAFSRNGIQWEIDEILTSEHAWLCGDTGGGISIFAGEEGQLAIRPDKGPVRKIEQEAWLEALRGDVSDFQAVMVMSSDKLIVITSTGQMLFSRDGGHSWSRENPLAEIRISSLKSFPTGDVFLTRRDGKVMRAELTARIGFSPELTSEQVLPGDLMSMTLRVPKGLDLSENHALLPETPLSSGEWAVSGDCRVQATPDKDDGHPGFDSGGALALSFDADERSSVKNDRLVSLRSGSLSPVVTTNAMRSYLDVRMTQKLDLSRLIEEDKLPFYRLELDAYTTGAINGPVEVWFSGSLPVTGASLTVREDAWQHRRVNILLPRGLKVDDELWINIGFSGSGTLHLDNIWFGRNGDAPGALSSLLNEVEHSVSSDVTRLEAVPIGRASYVKESWCLPEGTGDAKGDDRVMHNLGAALAFVERQQAVPWLVIDINVGTEELHHLIEYLAGSPLSVYGKLRSRDGAIGRWTDSFNLIYLEITDRDNILPNDASRANYVHWIMGQIKSAPDFSLVKNKLYFIDAMRYDDGRAHTSADYHAGDFHPDERPVDRKILESLLNEWENLIPRGQGSMLAPELIRSISFDKIEESVRLVDGTASVLGDLGDHSALALVDIDLSDADYLNGKHVTQRVLAVTGQLSGKRLLEEPSVIREGLEEAPPEEGETPVEESSVVFYAYASRDATTVYALNLGQSARVVSVQGIDHKSEAQYELYDHRGTMISSGVWKRKRDDFTLLPGGVLVIRQVSEAQD